MKPDNCYYLEYSNYSPHFYCYTQNVSVDMSFYFLQVFNIKLELMVIVKMIGTSGSRRDSAWIPEFDTKELMKDLSAET